MKNWFPIKNWGRFLILVLGLVLVIFFGLRVARAFVHLRQVEFRPERTDSQDIRGWMTISYISKAYHLPPYYLYEWLRIKKIDGNERLSLVELNRRYYPDQDGYVLQQVREAVAEYLQNASEKPARPLETPSPP
jgi:hypothetical protein